jgi:hypothetical protein
MQWCAFILSHFKPTKMVTVTNYAQRQRTDGTFFTTLELSGGFELVQSANTGKFYGTIRKTSIPCTFDESMAKQLIGTQMPGNIVRIQVDPYDFINPRTGELVRLQHSYSYQPEGSTELIGEARVSTLAIQ